MGNNNNYDNPSFKPELIYISNDRYISPGSWGVDHAVTPHIDLFDLRNTTSEERERKKTGKRPQVVYSLDHL